MKKIVSAVLLAAATTLSLSAHALTTADMLGHDARGAVPQSTIMIDSSTRYINVKQNDIVKLTDGSASVIWQFDGLNTLFPLSKVFPSAPNADDVKVYVELEGKG